MDSVIHRADLIGVRRALGLASAPRDTGSGIGRRHGRARFLVATDSLARGFAPPGSMLDPKSFYAIPFFETAVFGVLVAWALRARADGPAHKRLILIATISLMGPAVNR